MRRNIAILTAVLFTAFILALSCSKEDKVTDSGNNSPVIDSITADHDSLIAGELMTLSAWATDADGDNLNYVWAAPQGGIEFIDKVDNTYLISNCCAVTQVMLRYVTVTVSDNNNGSDKDSIQIRMVPSP